MTKRLQFKRYTGNTVATITGADGELIIDKSNNTITVHDGTTLGGHRLATEIYVNQQDNANAVVYSANSISLTGGVYVSGNVTDIQTLSDYVTGNFYYLTDGDSPTAPAWMLDIDFLNVVKFNRIVMNINYTASSGHNILIELYNNQTAVWDAFSSYSGLNGYYQFALETIDYQSYILNGRVRLRLEHSNQGSPSHETKLDYAALEYSKTGGQGTRGAAGARGATGAGVASGGTSGQILIKNSSSNNDTRWANNFVTGPYTDSSAAAANNVAIGSLYYTTDGTVKVRLT